MQSKFYIPASGDFVIISVHRPRERRCTWKFTFPLAGIRSRIDSSACGNAIKILHPRKRRFCNYFCAPSPRAEMYMKIYISPSRKYDPKLTVPRAGMQPKFYIPASRDFVMISVHRPRERRCTWKFTFPTRGNTIQPDNSACGNAKKILHLRERIFCYYFGSPSRLRKCTISCVSPRAEKRSGRCISASRICKRMCAVPQAVLQEIRSFLIPGNWTRYMSVFVYEQWSSTGLSKCEQCTVLSDMKFRSFCSDSI